MLEAEAALITPLSPTEKKRWRAQLTAYCLEAEAKRLNRGYSQRRRVLGYGLHPAAVQIDDCSGYDSKAVYYANVKSRLHVSDPLNNHFTGWGNTESIQAAGFHVAVGKIQVGDVVLWGKNDWDTSHTAICRKAGTKNTAIFSSHGHQSWRFHDDAPEGIIIPNFPEHLIGVYRLPELR